MDYPEEIKHELHSRVKTFFSDSGFQKLQDSFVIVVGLGGVGSHCSNMLVRSGVGHVRLIDFDQVTLSSLNRHALASMADVGSSKAEVLRRRLLEVVPWCRVEAVCRMFREEDAEMLLLGEWDQGPSGAAQSRGMGQGSQVRRPCMVVDAIDDISTKAQLLAFCLQHDIPVVTSMGAGGKADPTKLRIAPLSDCINDPLAQKLRWKLKKQHNLDCSLLGDKLTAVYSAEKPVVDLLPLQQEQKDDPQQYGAVDFLRIRVMPVLGTSPGSFGQALAAYVMCTLASGGLGGSGGLAGAVEAVGVGAGSGSTAEAKEIGEVVAGTVTGEAAETEGQQQEQTQQGQTQAQAQGQAQGQTQQTQQQQGKVQQHQGQGRLNANAPADCTQLFFNPDSGERMSRNLKHKVRQLLRKEEVRRFGSEDFLSLDEDDVEFVCQTVWRCRCAITGKRFGGHVVLVLTRWDPLLPPHPHNLVLLMQTQALKLEQGGPKAFTVEQVQAIERRLEWAGRVCELSWETLNHCGGGVRVGGGEPLPPLGGAGSGGAGGGGAGLAGDGGGLVLRTAYREQSGGSGGNRGSRGGGAEGGASAGVGMGGGMGGGGGGRMGVGGSLLLLGAAVFSALGFAAGYRLGRR